MLALDLTLGVLLGDIPGEQDTALKVFHPLLLLQHFSSDDPNVRFDRMFDRATRFCFYLLEKDPDTTGDDQVRSRNLALLIHSSCMEVPGPREFFTAAQLDSLMDYHLYICEDTACDLTTDTFWMLRYGSLNNTHRMRRYIDTIIRLRYMHFCPACSFGNWGRTSFNNSGQRITLRGLLKSICFSGSIGS